MADASPKFHPQEFLPTPPAAGGDLRVAHDGLAFWQFMVAGSVAGLVEHTAMFPVDTLKTRMQAQRPCQPPMGLRQALASVLRVEGPLGLYRGIGAMGLGAGPAHAVYFSVYETAKEFLSRGNPNNPAAHAGSGVLATVASDAVFTPMDTVKQRLQLRDSPYKGVADCVGRVLREEGPRAFFASYRTTVVMNAPFTAVHFATYEAAKRGLMEVSPESASDERLVVHATAGAAAGALAAAVTTPLDVVKTQLQCQELPFHQRADAVSSLVYEANARLRDPVYGCVGAISFLQNQVSQLQMQLAVAQAEILCIQMQQEAAAQLPNVPQYSTDGAADDKSSFLLNNNVFGAGIPQLMNFASSSSATVNGQEPLKKESLWT